MSKTINIERPALISEFSRKIRWDYNNWDVSSWEREELSELQKVVHHLVDKMGGDNVESVKWDVKFTRLLEGIVLIVDNNVSRDLEISKAVGDLQHIVWPANSIEMRFSDIGLPTVILNNEIRNNEQCISAVIDRKDGSDMVLRINQSVWKKYSAGDLDGFTNNSIGYETESVSVLRYMTVLAIKTLAYASVPHHKPSLINTKAEKKQAGIHPKQIRDVDKVYVVRYLPRIIRDKADDGMSNSTDEKRQFFGRAGCIRFYESDRYVNMKGQWQWIAPIPPPDGVKIIIKIRKV